MYNTLAGTQGGCADSYTDFWTHFVPGHVILLQLRSIAISPPEFYSRGMDGLEALDPKIPSV